MSLEEKKPIEPEMIPETDDADQRIPIQDYEESQETSEEISKEVSEAHYFEPSENASFREEKHVHGEPLKHKSETEKSSEKLKKVFEGLKKKDHTNTSKGLPKKNGRSFSELEMWKKVLIILGALFILGCVILFLFYQINRVDISDYTYTTREKSQVISADGVVIAEMFSQNRTYVTIDQIPKDLKNAIVATEDSRFYQHNGVDMIGIIRSLVNNLVNLDATGQGASTITQQLSRTLFLEDISTEQTLMDSVVRKLKEISISWQMDRKYSKEQILEMYLNETYFGSGAYGVEEAAKTYFGKSISECNLAECAMIAGLPQAPSAFAPNDDFAAAKERQAEVLGRMIAEGYITQEQGDEAYATEISIVPWSPEVLDNQISEGYGAFVSHALQEYAESKASVVMKEQGLSEEDAIIYIRGELAGGGYKIYTTIDTRFQTTAISSLSSRVESIGAEFTGALVTVENDGAIRAYYGGNTDVDMADTARQPGSGIKPLYYSCAFETGVATPSTTVVDEPTTFYGTYSPQNDGGGYSGTITFRQALIQSSNICSTKLLDMIGVEPAIAWMETMGITTFVEDDYHLATATGGMTYGIKPLEMAGAYNVFNSSGVYYEPYSVTEIQKTNGDRIFTKEEYDLDKHTVMSSETAATMWDILHSVVTSGTGTSASNSLVTAGKTGTTDLRRDVWFNGMSGIYSTSIWCGSVNNEIIGSGSYVPAGIYGNYMQSLYNNDVVSETR